METKRKAFILFILCIVWASIIFIGCTMPPKQLPKSSIPHIDKAAHFGFFFIQSVLLSFLFRYRSVKSYFHVILFSTLLAFIYGGFIEFLQNQFFNRTGDWYDLIADVIGGFFGAISPPLLHTYFKKN